MKIAGLLLMPAGWFLVVAAVALLPALPLRSLFVLAGVGVESLGLFLFARSHRIVKGEKE